MENDFKSESRETYTEKETMVVQAKSNGSFTVSLKKVF